MQGRGETVPSVPEETALVESDAEPITEQLGDESHVPEAKEDSPPKDESVRDTVIRSLKELQGKKDDGDQSASGESKEAQVVRTEDGKFAKKAPEQQQQIEDLDPDLSPPERLKTAEKQMFNNLPKGLKRAFNRSIKDLEGAATQKFQEIAREKEEVRSIRDAVMPYAQKWGSQGFTIPQGVAALAAAQDKLTNEETKLPTFYELAKDIGVPQDILESIEAHIAGVSEQREVSNTILNHPEFKRLQERQNALELELEQARSQEAIKPIVAQFQAVQQEIDPASGQLKYPELQDDTYLQSLKPRVTEIVRNEPQISFDAALRKAADENRSRLFGSSFQPTSRLPASQTRTQNTNTRAHTAAVSVRGRSAPAISPIYGAEPPPEALANPRATVEWALNSLRRG